MSASALTQEDMSRNPQAVLDVLEFYTEQQKRDPNEIDGMLIDDTSQWTGKPPNSQSSDPKSPPQPLFDVGFSSNLPF